MKATSQISCVSTMIEINHHPFWKIITLIFTYCIGIHNDHHHETCIRAHRHFFQNFAPKFLAQQIGELRRSSNASLGCEKNSQNFAFNHSDHPCFDLQFASPLRTIKMRADDNLMFWRSR